MVAPRDRAGMRFGPPPMATTPEVRWVLRAAFGPPGEPGGDPGRPAEAVRVAQALDLGHRIGHRVPADRLLVELGPAALADALASVPTALLASRRPEEVVPLATAWLDGR